MYRVSFIFRQNAFLEFVCTNIKDSLFALLPRGRGIRLVCTRSSFHEFYFYGKRFYHHIYPHPRPHLHSHSRPTFSRPLFPTLRAESVSKCCGSWVWVWVWVNVVGKKKKISCPKIKIKIKIWQKVVKLMKRRFPRTYLSHSPFPRSAKQISESFSTNGHSKETLYTM